MMKKPEVRTLLALIVLGLAGAAGWRFLRVTPPSPAPAPVIATVAPNARTQPSETTANDSAARLIARLIEWGKITNPAESDKLEIELKARITDENAGAIVRGLPPKLLETQFGFNALERWAKLDRLAAVTWLAQQTNPTPFQIGTALRGWISKDAAQAHRYVDGLPAGPWKEKVLAELGTDAVRQQEPVEAITLVRQMSPGATQTRLLKDASIVWAQQDPATAAEWVAKVNDPELQKTLIHMTAIGYAYKEPKAATEWLLQTLPPGRELDQAMAEVVGVWAAESRPQEAAVWVAELPEGSMRESAVKKLIERWREFNPSDASKWVSTLPSGSLRQQASEALAKPQT